MGAKKEEMTFLEEELAFYEAMGRAIAAWSRVEMALAGIAASSVRKPDRDAIGVGFFSIDVFRSKLQFTGNIISHKFETRRPKLFGDWTAVAKRLSGLSTKRNQIAHRPVAAYPSSKLGRRLALVPWLVPTNEKSYERDAPVSGDLCLRDLIQIETEFFAVRITLENFRYRMHGRKGPNPKSLEQPTHPLPSIRKIADHLHARLGYQRLSLREKRRLAETPAK